MKINFKREYRSSGKRNPATKGKPRFSYTVSGTPAELKAFKQAQGDFYVEGEDGAPILNLLQYVGKSANLLQTRDGRFVPETGGIPSITTLTQASSVAEQHPFLANAIANAIVGTMNIGSVSAPAVVNAPATADLGK